MLTRLQVSNSAAVPKSISNNFKPALLAHFWFYSFFLLDLIEKSPASKYSQHDSAYPQVDNAYTHHYSAYLLLGDTVLLMLVRT